MAEPISNRERRERAEEARIQVASRSTIPGMVTHQWRSDFYAEAMLDAVGRRKVQRQGGSE